jgi:hypothetical protein
MTALAGLSILAPASSLAAIWTVKAEEYRQLLAFGPIAGIGFLLLAPAFAAASWGCFRRLRWGWCLAVVLVAINALADLARAVTSGASEGWIGVAIAGALLWWLTRSRVRHLFAA